MRTLVLTSRLPVSETSGYDLRVANLCRQTPGELHLAVVPLAPGALGAEVTGFASVRWFGDLATTRLSVLRHLRTSDGHWLRTSRPRRFRDTVRRLADHVAELQVDRVVVFGDDLAELATAIGHPRTVLDVCDSFTLTQRRLLEAAPPVGRAARVSSRLTLARTSRLESRLPGRFQVVTAISEQDSQCIRDLAGGAARVVTVPNGVDEQFLTGMLPPGHRDGVAFWGNLSFGPNQAALRYFLDEIYVPHLRAVGVHVRIIGPNAPAWLQQVASSDPGVELMGFVPDLRDAVAGFPIAVNAMRTGSGLKNKVLEAFGLGLVVVTTTRGVEALGPVTDHEHVRIADEPESFAAAVLELLSDRSQRERLRNQAHALLHSEYDWSVVGETWRRLLAPV